MSMKEYDRKVINIVKRYTIKFSYAGIAQYADFGEQENGELVNPSLMVSYAKTSDVPDVSKMTKIEDVLKAIKKFAYNRQAKIEEINGMPVFYYKKTEMIELVSNIKKSFEEFLELQSAKFFNSELRPLLIKNKWKISSSHIGMPVLIEKNKKGEWQNIDNQKKEFEFEYLCKAFLKSVGMEEKRFSFSCFTTFLPSELYNEFFIKL